MLLTKYSPHNFVLEASFARTRIYNGQNIHTAMTRMGLDRDVYAIQPPAHHNHINWCKLLRAWDCLVGIGFHGHGSLNKPACRRLHQHDMPGPMRNFACWTIVCPDCPRISKLRHWGFYESDHKASDLWLILLGLEAHVKPYRFQILHLEANENMWFQSGIYLRWDRGRGAAFISFVFWQSRKSTISRHNRSPQETPSNLHKLVRGFFQLHWYSFDEYSYFPWTFDVSLTDGNDGPGDYSKLPSFFWTAGEM